MQTLKQEHRCAYQTQLQMFCSITHVFQVYLFVCVFIQAI